MTDTPMLLPEAAAPVATQESWGSEFDQVRATVQALQGAAALLQGALEQREGLWAEMRSAERALTIARAQLERTTSELNQVKSEQSGVVAEFDRLVHGAMTRRGALVNEIADLERRRDALLIAPAMSAPALPITPVAPAMPTPIEVLAPTTPATPFAAVQTLEAASPATALPTFAADQTVDAAAPVTPSAPFSGLQTVRAASPAASFAGVQTVDAGAPTAPVATVQPVDGPAPIAPAVPFAAVQAVDAAAPVSPLAAVQAVDVAALPGPFAPPVVAAPAFAPVADHVTPVAPVVQPVVEPVAPSFARLALEAVSDVPITPVVAPEPPVALPSQSSPRRRLHVPSLRTLFTSLLAALLIGLAILLTPVTQVAGGLQLLAVMSGSMEPTIHTGGIVGVRPVAASDLQVGDIITFTNPSNPDVLITHRVVSLEARGPQTLLTTKGDANDTVDAVTTSTSRAVGRVEFTAPYLGFLMVWLATPVAKVGILAISILGFALSSMKRTPAPTRAEDSKPSYQSLERELQTLLPGTNQASGAAAQSGASH